MHTGRCLCGAVRLEIGGDGFLYAYYCHCSHCRRATGSSFASNAFVRSEDLRVAQGDDVLRAFESAPGAFRQYCGSCGSPLFMRNENVPQVRSVRLGVVDGDPGVRPRAHVFVGSKAPWLEIRDDLPSFLEGEFPYPTLTPAEWAGSRRFVETRFGRIAYVERGEGPAALFLMSAPFSGFHWRHQLAGLADLRRCIAPDLLGVGHSEIDPDAEIGHDAQAEMLLAFLDALGIERVDLVGGDSGGGIAQIVAARAPERVRSLALTNCEADGNWPPQAFEPLVELAKQGGFAALMQSVRGQTQPYESVYERHAERAEALEVYHAPLLASPERMRILDRLVASADPTPTRRIRPQLEKLDVPTLVVWGLADPYFGEESADWLAQTIPGIRRVVKLPNAKLLLAEERPFETNALLREHWNAA